MDKREHPYYPCPSRVLTDVGWRFCEQGHLGHDGTCHGDRSAAEYNTLVLDALEHDILVQVPHKLRRAMRRAS